LDSTSPPPAIFFLSPRPPSVFGSAFRSPIVRLSKSRPMARPYRELIHRGRPSIAALAFAVACRPSKLVAELLLIAGLPSPFWSQLWLVAVLFWDGVFSFHKQLSLTQNQNVSLSPQERHDGRWPFASDRCLRSGRNQLSTTRFRKARGLFAKGRRNRLTDIRAAFHFS